jgi:hypothetical protein
VFQAPFLVDRGDTRRDIITVRSLFPRPRGGILSKVLNYCKSVYRKRLFEDKIHTGMIPGGMVNGILKVPGTDLRHLILGESLTSHYDALSLL